MASANGRKSIFITGAASGIGAETARLFSEKGWFCGLYDINTAGLADVAGELGTGNSVYAKLDVRDRNDWALAVKGFSEAT
ncbi:MAG: SDR family NAD(P)-dependent oxidoreductase, partial [Hyphomonas sp.]|nr:SDR family NAD(P)-dependent oxidoreductase [Hyphomonas sp.]